MGAGSDGRSLVIGAWRTRVPGGKNSRMVAAMMFGLTGVLKAEVVHVGGCKEVGDVSDAVS